MEALLKSNRVLLVIYGTEAPYSYQFLVNWSRVMDEESPSYAADLLKEFESDRLQQTAEKEKHPYFGILRYAFMECDDKEKLRGKFDQITMILGEEGCLNPHKPATWFSDHHMQYEPYGSTDDISKFCLRDIKVVFNDYGQVVMGDASEFEDEEICFVN